MNLEIFKNSNWEIRVLEKAGESWFVASDVAKALGYNRSGNAINCHCKRQRTASKQNGFMSIIPESDIYRLIARSKLPSAEEFENWVMDEVLPSIRKHGLCATPQKIKELVENPDLIIEIARKLKTELKEKEMLKQLFEIERPRIQFAKTIEGSESNISMGQMAKLNGKIGRNKLFRKLREAKILMNNNIPYQNYLDRGYFKLSEVIITRTKGDVLQPVTLVTGKGQLWLNKKIDQWVT